MTPPKEVYNRWNNFCDANSPAPGGSGKPIRDPKLLSKELIKDFMAGELPRNFWVFLIKKIQANSEQLGISPNWDDFCDRHAPRLPQNREKAIRDPRSLDLPFLLAFIACNLERDDRQGGGLAALIDDYKFDFSLPGSEGANAGRHEALPRSRQAREEPPPRMATGRLAIGQPPGMPGGGLPRGPAYGSRPPRGRRRSRSPSAGRGRRGRGHEDGGQWGGDSGQFSAPGQLAHGILHRLLKLVQRNQGSTPPKEIYNRWNDFCDANCPPITDGGRPVRDPKLVSKELILDFMLQLPQPWWISLVKKIQANGFREEWNEYCECFAPPLGDGSAKVRDPRKLELEFLLSFVASALERDDPQVGILAGIIDAYEYDFDPIEAVPRKTSKDGQHGKGRGKGGEESGSHEQESKGRFVDEEEDQAVFMLSRVVKLLQRSSQVVKRKWDAFCDENADQHRGVAIRDPRKQSPELLRGFLCNEIPTTNWVKAVEHGVTAVPSISESLDGFMQEAVETFPDPWMSPEALLQFLCGALEQNDEVADVIAVAAEGLEE